MTTADDVRVTIARRLSGNDGPFSISYPNTEFFNKADAVIRLAAKTGPDPLEMADIVLLFHSGRQA